MNVIQDSKKLIFRRVRTVLKFLKYSGIEILLKPWTFRELQCIHNLIEDIREHIIRINLEHCRKITGKFCSFAWQAQMLLLEDTL